MSENAHLQAISTAVIDGEAEDAVEATQKALDANVDPLEILNIGLMEGANERLLGEIVGVVQRAGHPVCHGMNHLLITRH